MTRDEIARTFYESARTELIERIGHRDNVLLYLGAVGAVFGVSFGTTGRVDVLLVIPILAFGAAFVLAQHHEVIGVIGRYLAVELHPYFCTLADGDCPPQWDTSNSLAAYHKKAIGQRFWAQLFLLVVPAVVGLVFTSTHWSDTRTSLGWVWWLGTGFTVGTIALIGKAHYRRRKLSAEQTQGGREAVI